MIRRIIDILIALMVLPLVALLMPFISLAIVVESPGNPFYGTPRVGKYGKLFRMWKFRTMVIGADRMGSAVTTALDPRITRVGRFLRKTKLDEWPQFFNLLLGDLTLIGPRPEDPGIVQHYSAEQREVLQVKPGITGPTQIHYTTIEAEAIPDGKNAERFYIDRLLGRKLQLDLEYLKSRTLFSDCRVLLQTVSLITIGLNWRKGARDHPEGIAGAHESAHSDL
jgi:lipopolysaccharide/colanic/teichoic acid biosynthesis glycosyltransferase